MSDRRYSIARWQRLLDHTGADAVHEVVANAAKTSVAEIDGQSLKELKCGLAEAQAGLSG